MRAQVLAGFMGLALAGCSGGSGPSSAALNPFNWFGKKDQPVAVDENGNEVIVLKTLSPRKGYIEFTDTRPLMPAISALRIDRMPNGAIVTATGVSPNQGYYDAALVKVDSGAPGVLMLEFRVQPPASAMPVGPAHLREITAAAEFSDEQLFGVRTITVRAASGSRSARR